MKIELKNGEFITDNSLECVRGCYFVATWSNERFKSLAANSGVKIISPREAINLVNLRPIKIIGITGTNGKTTSAALIAHALNSLGHKCALSGTRGAFIADKKIAPKGLTTSQFLETLSYLKVASDENCEYFVMEVSSHAIAQKRVEGLEFALKIFTNLTQDHLDYHKTFEEYARVKSSFFADESFKLINADDEFIRFCATNSHLYSCVKDYEFTAVGADFSGGIKASLKSPSGEVRIHSSLQGKFNLYNILCAFGALNLLGFAPQKIADALSEFTGVEGRVEVVSHSPLVIVDFAHTPDGIDKVLNALSHEKLIVVFGAGGDRDKTKRPIMGRIAQKYAKIAIVTSDNPRSEDPEAIINEIISGMDASSEIIRQSDRKKAIKTALDLATNGEAVVILGKGDETTQEINGVKYPFSDKEVVLNLLKEAKK